MSDWQNIKRQNDIHLGTLPPEWSRSNDDLLAEIEASLYPDLLWDYEEVIACVRELYARAKAEE